jgi:SAM-dependent methyltransferase
MDGPWGMELDEANRWVDAVPMEGIIVELGAGTGWWSALLAGKGELWIYDADGQALDQARKRLMAHDLLAHIHERDPLAPADKRADVVFAAHLLGAASDEAGLVRRLDTVLGWLKPGATFCFLEVSQVSDGPVDGPNGLLYPRSRDTLGEALTAAGFVGIDLAATPTAFVMGRAQAPVVDSSA